MRDSSCNSFGNNIKENNTLVSYTYNNYNGKLATMTYGNGTKVEYVYDELDRVAEVWYTENGSIVITYTETANKVPKYNMVM